LTTLEAANQMNFEAPTREFKTHPKTSVAVSTD
jgi:hypothetical protein